MSSYTLDRLEDLAGIAKVRKDALAQARAEIREAIVEARTDGHSLAAIARSIGTTRQYVHLVLKAEKEKQS